MIWYLKQLLPLRYQSQYAEILPGGGERKLLTIWRMWFGRCFNVQTWELA